MRSRHSLILAGALAGFLITVQLSPLTAGEPKQTPKNTISPRLESPVRPQTFSQPPKFYVLDTINRSGDPQPLLVYRRRGGIFLDREPRLIVREGLEESLQAAGLLAPDEASADCLLTVYLFHFGLASGTGREFFSKVELSVVVKNPRTGRSQQVPALGTSIEKGAFRKKNKMKRIQANLEEALEKSLRNFLRGIKLRDALQTIAASSPPD